ncbi:DUF4349 domain-containing protein [Pontibacter cellulosilyticus]|uniref:DUF4349 domain-containing protein n=1 Tax=Pontibacter cellulosilyticus TaxID=1720253 RepID=A0A923NBG2_9BACT|nr:DUF4349 domain-containing protein [Pontibacter cellulosilyticus]MBC5994352.1 DUF4349 domain-containing protein [Pontibacter cellulosilyticus]
MRFTSYFILGLLLLIVTACESGMDTEEMEASMAEKQALITTPADATPLLSDRKIIRQANLRLQVQDLDESSNRIEALVKKYNATITNSRSYNGNESIESTFTIKVVPENLFALVKDIQAESIFLDDKAITADDVTMQYVDVEARIKAKQTAQQRYLELMKQATKVEDVLAIEVELRKVQEELEAVQAQLKALQQQTSFSTINLTMYQLVPASYTDRTSFSTRAVSAFSSGWHLFKGLIVGVLYLWPILIVAALFILGLRWQKRKKRGLA